MQAVLSGTSFNGPGSGEHAAKTRGAIGLRSNRLLLACILEG